MLFLTLAASIQLMLMLASIATLVQLLAQLTVQLNRSNFIRTLLKGVSLFFCPNSPPTDSLHSMYYLKFKEVIFMFFGPSWGFGRGFGRGFGGWGPGFGWGGGGCGFGRCGGGWGRGFWPGRWF